MSEMSIPITIVIPVYKRTTYFREALRSALAQTVPVEVLVVDDGTPGRPDGFQKIIAEEGNLAKYIYCEINLGQAGHWNRCLEIAQTPWVSMLHDDDVLMPNGIELLFQAQQAMPGYALYFGLENEIDEKGAIRVSKLPLVTRQCEAISPVQFALHNQFGAAGALLHRDTIKKLSGFDSRAKMTPDWDLWVRICLYSGAVRIREIVASYRSYFDMSRGTSLQEIDGSCLIRIKVQQRRNIARLKKVYPDSEIPVDSLYDTSRMARDLLIYRGKNLTQKGRRIYFLYGRRPFVKLPGISGKWKLYKADLQHGVYFAYSYVRPLWLAIRKFIFNK